MVGLVLFYRVDRDLVVIVLNIFLNIRSDTLINRYIFIGKVFN